MAQSDAKAPPFPGSSLSIYRGGHGMLRPCRKDGKRAATSQVRCRSWRAMRPRTTLGDPDAGSSAQISGAKRTAASKTLFSVSLSRTMRDWANLGEGPAGLVAEHLLANDVADYVRFRAVCRPWRLCTTDPRAHGVLDRRFHPRQWILLRERLSAPPYRRRLLNVSTGRSICTDLPQLHGHDVFGPTTEGLLILLHRATSVVRLLNPLTLQSADLPPANTLLTQRHVDLGVELEVSGAGLAGNSMFAVSFGSIETLAVVKPGDEHWTVIDRGSLFVPAISVAGRFYCVTDSAVMVVETSTDQPPRLVMATKLPRRLSQIMMDSVHLVDNDGELILVDSKHTGIGIRDYKVYQVDLDEGKVIPVRGLGGRAAFIGMERAFSVSPSVFPTISADAIYLAFDEGFTGGVEKSPFHLMDGIAEPRDVYDESTGDDGMPWSGPLGVDHYLSWCVTSYRDDAQEQDELFFKR